VFVPVVELPDRLEDESVLGPLMVTLAEDPEVEVGVCTDAVVVNSVSAGTEPTEEGVGVDDGNVVVLALLKLLGLLGRVLTAELELRAVVVAAGVGLIAGWKGTTVDEEFTLDELPPNSGTRPLSAELAAVNKLVVVDGADATGIDTETALPVPFNPELVCLLQGLTLVGLTIPEGTVGIVLTTVLLPSFDPALSIEAATLPAELPLLVQDLTELDGATIPGPVGSLAVALLIPPDTASGSGAGMYTVFAATVTVVAVRIVVVLVIVTGMAMAELLLLGHETYTPPE
jgi:hypothetical protein